MFLPIDYSDSHDSQSLSTIPASRALPGSGTGFLVPSKRMVMISLTGEDLNEPETALSSTGAVSFPAFVAPDGRPSL